MENHKKVLAVDDDESVRNLCVRVLRKDRYDVVTAESGDKALEILSQENFDLVLTDIFMPGKTDGIKLLHEIKKIYPKTDVIMITAQPTVENAVQTLKEGAYDYLIKPFDPQELEISVNFLMEKRKLERELEKTYKELKKLNDFRETIMQLLVHDMKNPLSGIIGNAQVMLMDHLSQEQEETLKDILVSSQRLHQMVINLLEIGKMEEGRFIPKCEPVKVIELFDEIRKIIGSQFEHKNIKFSIKDIPEGLTIFSDRDLMIRLLQNLLENSLRYTFENGIVELSAYARENSYFISVKDNGQSVPQEFRESIFTRYGRMTKSGERTNSGLALYFCKLAAEAHGGTIELEDSEKGCSFLIKLPNKNPKAEVK